MPLRKEIPAEHLTIHYPGRYMNSFLEALLIFMCMHVYMHSLHTLNLSFSTALFKAPHSFPKPL